MEDQRVGGREVGVWEECTGGQGEGGNGCKMNRVQKCYLCFENHIGLEENFYNQEDV